MPMSNAPAHKQKNATDWTLEIFIPLIIVLILTAGGIFLSLETGWSEYSRKEIVAYDTYAQYSQELDSISKRCAKKINAE
jgi:uncharacterized membrane protein